MRVFTIIYFLFFNVLGAVAQQKVGTPLLKTACNCKSAIPLNVNPGSNYGPTEAPKLFGSVQEISTPDKNSEISFSEEHNTAWYLLTIKFDGELSFVINPTDSTNDYDFLLYPWKDSSFCSRLLKRTVTPLRGNLSNNTPPHNRGATGLSSGVVQSFHCQGPGNSFSASLQVKKGEKYMLVLDNVTTNGGGHTISFRNLVNVTINGTVTGSEGLPLVAGVNLADPEGKTIEQTTTDVKGKYEIKTVIEPNKNYGLTYTTDSSFIGSETINTTGLKGSHTFSGIRTVLPKLIKGTKHPLGNINFYADQAVLLPQSLPSVEALLRLMRTNKKLVIRIEGHVNAANMEERDIQRSEKEFQVLSDNRARTVRDYLVQRGISTDRISTIGLAAKQMLFPQAKNEQEQSANRRVEIRVISVNGE